MTDVKDKIAKLLALAADTPYEGEKKAAILRARALMAEYKLRPEECQKTEDVKVVQSLVGIDVTARKYAWGVNLSAIIAKHYCCVSYRNHQKGSQTQRIGFVGTEDDFEICTRIFRYAFDYAKSRSDEIFQEDADWYSAQQRRKNAEAYGWAFCEGLREALETQQEEHQEWGLVMVVPQVVRDTVLGKQKPKAYGNHSVVKDGAVSARVRGYQDGRKFDPSTKLAEAKAPLEIGGALV